METGGTRERTPDPITALGFRCPGLCAQKGLVELRVWPTAIARQEARVSLQAGFPLGAAIRNPPCGAQGLCFRFPCGYVVEAPDTYPKMVRKHGLHLRHARVHDTGNRDPAS